ncbi:MAG: hypothetical protein WBC60_15075 [Cognaticolwellia sp.]
MLKQGIIIVACIGLVSCAKSTLNYTPPSNNKITNSIELSESFDNVWKKLVRKLSSDFFVINNIEKESNIINVSFSVNRPSDFVDCGISTREFSNARGKNNYNYNPADPANYTMTNGQGEVFNVNRFSSLEGVANIYIADEGNKTIVSVNARYIIKGGAKYFNVYNQPAGQSDWTFNLSTNQPYSDVSSKDSVVCVSKGVIESKILEYVKA